MQGQLTSAAYGQAQLTSSPMVSHCKLPNSYAQLVQSQSPVAVSDEFTLPQTSVSSATHRIEQQEERSVSLAGEQHNVS